MKKRIFLFALMIAVLLTSCSFANADETPYHTISTTLAEYSTIYKITDRKGASFKIRVRTSIGNNDENGGAYSDRIRWIVSQDANTIKELKLVYDDDNSITDAANASYDVTIGSAYTYQMTLTGTINQDGNVCVTTLLYSGDKTPASSTNSNVKVSGRATVTFTAKDGTEERTEGFPSSGSDVVTIAEVFKDGYTEAMKSDPYDDDAWDGIDPAFPKTAHGVKAGDKNGTPKLKTSRISDFRAGTASTATIEITGAAPNSVDVYIAAKDAIKLYGASHGITKENAKDIQLTQASIKTYMIPFRITEANISSADSKTATSSLTLAFNGANVAYKGFPLTVSVANTNTKSGKPAKKTLKINVTPNTTAPVWYYDGYVATAMSADYSLHSKDVIGILSGTQIMSRDHVVTVPSGDKYYTVSTDNVVLVSCDAENTVKVHHSWSEENPALIAIDSKTKKNDPDALEVVALAAANEGNIEEKTYYVSADSIAPYDVTWKAPKDNNIKVTYTKPTYDHWGNVTEHASITIGGEVSTLTKETKNALTFTAANPSTGKKTALKVDVIGKVPPTFDKLTNTGYLDKVKRVEAGKVPSITFKAKGSKTITYSIDEDDQEALEAVNLSFDTKKGKVVLKERGAKTLPTLNDSDEFESIDIMVMAVNSVGEAEALAEVAVTGAKVKANTTKVEFTVGDAKGTTKTITMKNVTATTEGHKVKFYEPPSGHKKENKTALSGIGLAIVDTWSEATVANMVEVSADYALTTSDDYCLFATSKDYVPFQIISKDSGAELGDGSAVEKVFTSTKDAYSHKYIFVSGDGGAYISADEDADVPETYFLRMGTTEIVSGEKANPDKNSLILSLSDASALSNGLKNGKKGNVKFNIIADNYGAEAVLGVTVTVNPAATASAASLVTETAAGSKTADSKNAAKTRTGKGNADYGEGSDVEAEAEAEVDEKDALTFGAPRTAANLSSAQKALLAEKGYVVVAVLPEITAKTEGQHDIDVELDEEAPEGATLIWLPFPKDAGSEDDDIVDFYDEAGALVEGVPASHKIIASPWFREGVTYEPVIAVEAE